MAVINAWNFPGASGDYATNLPGVHFRTGSGQAAWTWGAVIYLDTISPGSDGVIFASKRESNDAQNHQLVFNDGGNNLEYQYNSGAQFSTGSLAATTWYLVYLKSAGNGGNMTIGVIPLSTGVQAASSSGASGGSVFNDSQTQQLEIGGRESGGTTDSEFDGRICLPFVLSGTALSQAQLEAFASDPLATIDQWVQTYGTDLVFAFDDSATDQSPNSASLSLQGSVALGTSNGPDIPAREAAGPTVVAVGPGDFGIVFDGELRVTVDVLNAGASQGTGGVYLHTADILDGTEISQTARSWSDTAIVIDVDLDTLDAGPLYLHVEDDNGASSSLLIQVKVDPAGVPQVRTSIPGQSATEGVAFSLQTAPHFYDSDAQELLTFSDPTDSLPPSLSISAGGLISGVLDADADGSSPYSVTVRGTDPDGNTAEDTFTVTVTGAVSITPVTDPRKDWRRRPHGCWARR